MTASFLFSNAMIGQVILDGISSWLSKFWKKFLDWLWWLLDNLFTPFKWVLDGFFTVFETIAYAVFDGFLTTVVLIFNAFDFSSVLFSRSSGWLGLPDQLVWLITQLGLPQCFSLFGLALGIRLLINLLPASITRI